jgi:protein ImuB
VRDLATVLARLVALVGAENVGAIAPADSHHPDAFATTMLRVDAEADAEDAGRDDDVLAFRRLRPPRVIDVETDATGRPAVVHGALSAVARVCDCAGPWHVSGDWWDRDRWAREEWDVALDDRTVVRLARDLLRGEWLLDAVYD